MPTRRDLLLAPLGIGALSTLGCGQAGRLPPETQPAANSDPFAGGERLGLVPFVGEERPPLDMPLGAELDGRLYTDLTLLEPGATVRNDRFYIRTRTPSTLPHGDDWKIRLGGQVKRPLEIPIAELRAAERSLGRHVMECAGNTAGGRFGMLGMAEWTGVPLLEILERVKPRPGATQVLVAGFDRHSQASRRSMPGASWVFTPEQLREAGAFLATRMNGEPLLPDHGYPVRLVVPGWYGCVSAKWVDEIRWTGDAEPATSQMREFASRTHQSGTPVLARDFLPARIDRAAMPVRVEKWRVDGQLLYRIVGIAWGGQRETDLEIRFTPDGAYERVATVAPSEGGTGWAWWSHPFRPKVAADHALQLRVANSRVPTRRLDRGFYVRYARIEEI